MGPGRTMLIFDPAPSHTEEASTSGEVCVVAISTALLRDGTVDVEAYVSAVDAGRPVGVCGCGGLLAGSTEQGRGLLWLTTWCQACGAETTSPGGRVLARPEAARRAQPAWLLEAAAEQARRFPERDAPEGFARPQPV